jgi:hypothetical protein
MFSIRSVEYTFSDSIRCVSIRFVSIRCMSIHFVKYTFREYTFREYTFREYTFCEYTFCKCIAKLYYTVHCTALWGKHSVLILL